VTAGKVQQQDVAGVLVAPELCRWLHAAVLAQLRADEYRDGGLPSPPGLLGLLQELRAAASGSPAARLGTVEATPVPVTAAAGLAGVSQRRMRQLAAEGKVRARRFGRDWQIDPDSAREWPARRPVTHRKADGYDPPHSRPRA
jgi:hypothetical protein